MQTGRKSAEKLTKSKERVKKLGEVFTPDWVVRDMCDMLQNENQNENVFGINKTYLEPACGTGNFLVEIYRRKLERCKNQRDGIKSLYSIFGIDIMQDNVDESRNRLFQMFVDKWPDSNKIVQRMARKALNQNIVCGNFLTKLTSAGDKIWFLEE